MSHEAPSLRHDGLGSSGHLGGDHPVNLIGRLCTVYRNQALIDECERNVRAATNDPDAITIHSTQGSKTNDK